MAAFAQIMKLLYPENTAAINSTVTIQTSTKRLYRGTIKNIPPYVLNEKWTIVSIVPDYNIKYSCSDDTYKDTPVHNLPKIITVI